MRLLSTMQYFHCYDWIVLEKADQTSTQISYYVAAVKTSDQAFDDQHAHI